MKAFPGDTKEQMSNLHWNIGAPERAEKLPVVATENMLSASVSNWRWPAISVLRRRIRSSACGGSLRPDARVRRQRPRRPHRRPDAGKGYGYARHPASQRPEPRMGITDRCGRRRRWSSGNGRGYAAKLNALSPIALASLKKVLNSAYDSPLKTSLEVEGHSYDLRWTHDYSRGSPPLLNAARPSSRASRRSQHGAGPGPGLRRPLVSIHSPDGSPHSDQGIAEL